MRGRNGGSVDLFPDVGVQIDTPDLAVARIAANQHGALTFEQLLEAGLGRHAIYDRVARGFLHRVHRGVYAVGHTGLSDEGRWMAAVLASGPGAVLSHAGAAALWGLLRPISGPIDISVPGRTGRGSRAGIRLHRCPSLAAGLAPALGRNRALVTRRRGIPVTTPARTVADLSGSVPPHLERRARRQAELLGMTLSGIATDRTRSDLEAEFLGLCRQHGLPSLEVNVRVGRWTVDFLWRGRRLVVETDSYLYHRGEVAFGEDRARDIGLRRLGYAVHRYTEAQIRDRPDEIAVELGEFLSRADDRHSSG